MGLNYSQGSPSLNQNFSNKKIIDISLSEKHCAALDSKFTNIIIYIFVILLFYFLMFYCFMIIFILLFFYSLYFYSFILLFKIKK
jgi:hypothetical protein